MRIVCVTDSDHETGLSADLLRRLRRAAEARGHTFEIHGVVRGDVAFCTGCLRCWSGGTGRCVVPDRARSLEELLPGCGLLVLVSPVHFGHFSSTIKSVIDKGLGCKLELDLLLPQLVIGYGEDVTDDERDCFVDLIARHRGNADIVHPECAGVPWHVAVTRSRDDNADIAAAFERRHAGEEARECACA